MNKRPLIRIVAHHAIGIIVAVASLTGSAYAESPTAVISNLNKNLLTTMQAADKLGYDGRYAKLAPTIKSAFDIYFMTRYSAGRYWRSLSNEQKVNLVNAFGRLTVASYANRFDGYSGEKFHVLKEESPRKDTKLVRTELEKSDGERIKLNYLLRSKKGRWKIIDVFVKGTISELSTKRSEYSSTLKSKGFNGLIGAMEKKIAQLAVKDIQSSATQGASSALESPDAKDTD